MPGTSSQDHPTGVMTDGTVVKVDVGDEREVMVNNLNTKIKSNERLLCLTLSEREGQLNVYVPICQAELCL